MFDDNRKLMFRRSSANCCDIIHIQGASGADCVHELSYPLVRNAFEARDIRDAKARVLSEGFNLCVRCLGI